MRDHLVEQVQQEERIAEQSRRADMAIKMLAKEAAARIDGELAETSAFTVLVVDDEPQVRSFLVRALSQYKVVEAGDGNEALEIIQGTPPDLVLADIRMPDMDGFALLGKLREIDPNVPVVAISGFASEEDVIEYEFDGFLPKPIDLETVMQTVEKSLSRQ
jgi:CheY-like chemotaxis protein